MRVLSGATCDKRFNPDQQMELRALLEEARRAPDPRAGALRPILNPADVCNLLQPISVGPDPVLTPEVHATIEEWIDGWLREAELLERSLRPPGPLLLYGETGGGKSIISQFIARRLSGVRRGVVIEVFRVIDSHMGQSGKNLEAAFEAVKANAGLVVVEEIDGIAETRKSGTDSADRENNRNTIGLMRLIEACPAAVIATTNRIDSLDNALLRRFEYKLKIPLASEEMRRSILGRLLGAKEVPERLVSLPLSESVPLTQRVVRVAALKKLSLDDATVLLLAA